MYKQLISRIDHLEDSLSSRPANALDSINELLSALDKCHDAPRDYIAMARKRLIRMRNDVC